MTRFGGAIFDLNGTLVDDIPFHFRAWRELAMENGLDLDEAAFQSWNGMKNEEILPALLGRSLTADEVAEFSRTKESIYRALYREHIQPTPGAEDFLNRLRGCDMKLALASSAPWPNRSMIIEALGWGSRFDAIVEASPLPSKPAPDIFLDAAKQMGVDPSVCIVFEDSVNGVKAGVAAGMYVVGVSTNVPAKTLKRAGARAVVSDFTAPELTTSFEPTQRRIRPTL